jgi:hypothetical protein
VSIPPPSPSGDGGVSSACPSLAPRTNLDNPVARRARLLTPESERPAMEPDGPRGPKSTERVVQRTCTRSPDRMPTRHLGCVIAPLTAKASPMGRVSARSRDRTNTVRRQRGTRQVPTNTVRARRAGCVLVLRTASLTDHLAPPHSPRPPVRRLSHSAVAMVIWEDVQDRELRVAEPDREPRDRTLLQSSSALGESAR